MCVVSFLFFVTVSGQIPQKDALLGYSRHPDTRPHTQRGDRLFLSRLSGRLTRSPLSPPLSCPPPSRRLGFPPHRGPGLEKNILGTPEAGSRAGSGRGDGLHWPSPSFLHSQARTRRGEARGPWVTSRSRHPFLKLRAVGGVLEWKHRKSPSVCCRELQIEPSCSTCTRSQQSLHEPCSPSHSRPSLPCVRTPVSGSRHAPGNQIIDRTAVDGLPSSYPPPPPPFFPPLPPLLSTPSPTKCKQALKRGEIRSGEVCGLWCPSSLHSQRISGLSQLHLSTLLSNGRFNLVWETSDAKEEKEGKSKQDVKCVWEMK